MYRVKGGVASETVFKQGGLIPRQPQFLSTEAHGKVDVLIILFGQATHACLFLIVIVIVIVIVVVVVMVWMNWDGKIKKK